MVTAVMADLVEKVALLMVEAVEKDMMPLAAYDDGVSIGGLAALAGSAALAG